MNAEARFYRIAIWLPLVLPAGVWVAVRAFGMPAWDPLSTAAAVLLISLLYGGLPYAALALWAAWRSRTLNGSSIRRLALRAPLSMVGAFLPYALVVGVFGGEWRGGVALFGLGALYILPLGYLYVAVVLVVGSALHVREQRRARIAAPAV